MKAGIVALVGRPNAGKSTLVNAIIGHKVAITSPKPQTTRFAIQAIFEDPRGQILFVDTPGIFAKTPDTLSRAINPTAESVVINGVNVVLYIVDHTKKRDIEENKAIGIIRKATVPKIMVLNKADIKEPTHIVQYKFLEEEFDTTISISALKGTNIPSLLDTIFSFLPEGPKMVDATTLAQPVLNLDSKTYIAEIIREKVFLNLFREVPYSITVVVDEIIERPSKTLYIKARILTTHDKYKGMIVGKNGRMIKEISMAGRKELEIAANKKVFLDLTVEVDEHWVEQYG